MNLDYFTASNGWLHSFQRRNNIKESVLSGESADVPEEQVHDWCLRLSTICDGYEPKDIFNADETGLFYRALPERSLVAKGDSCKGGKKSKDRVTVLLACSAAGEKLKPLVIGRKAANPRCFRGYNLATLPVTYYANRKAWVTGDLFKKWLNLINNQMKRQNRDIRLFIDNCAAHPDVTLSNVKLRFLPPNTTSHLQPLDAGIIKATKSVYRKQLIRHILFRTDEVSSASEMAKCVNVVDAINWIHIAWNGVSPDTIRKCFARCGFSVDPPLTPTPPPTNSEDHDTPPEDYHVLLRDISWEEYVSFDDALETAVNPGPSC